MAEGELKGLFAQESHGYCVFNVNKNNPKENKCVNAKCTSAGENCVFPVVLLSDVEKIVAKAAADFPQDLFNVLKQYRHVGITLSPEDAGRLLGWFVRWFPTAGEQP